MYFKKVLFFGFLLGLSMVPGRLLSKHIIGGEVTYICLGETPGNVGYNSYLITMKIYRDCDPAAGGANFDWPANIGIYTGSYDDNNLFEKIETSPTLVTKIVPDTPQCIKNMPYACVQEGLYEFTVDLPISQTDSYFIVYQRCCRNNSIVNIYNPEDVGATYYVEITPSSQQLCNTTPTYNEFPPIIICKDVPLTFDHQATDVDGDVLVYRFCAPEVGGGMNFQSMGCDAVAPDPPCGPPFTPVPYIQPQYTALNPMGGNPQITINPVTGVISGTPNVVGRFVVGVCVDEYRNGVKLSSIRRDFQFNVADCDPTVVAQIDGGDTLVYTPDGYYLSSCGAKSLYIENKSVDLSFIETFEWRFNLGGTPYFNNTDWSPIVDFPATGRYYGLLFLNPGAGVCADTANITVDIFPEVNAAFEFSYDTCVAGPVVFTDLSTGEGGLNKWRWQFGVPNGTAQVQNPSYLYTIPGDHQVRLRVTDQNGCSDAVTQPVSYFPAPQYIIVHPEVYSGCAPREVEFKNLSLPIDSTYEVIWDYGDGVVESGAISPVHRYEKPGIFTVSVKIISPFGCEVSDTFPQLIQLYAPPVADFSYTPEFPDRLHPEVRFTDESVDAERWFWQFDQYGTSGIANPSFTFPDTGRVRVLLVVTHREGCKDSVVQYIRILPVVRWFMPNAFTPNGDGDNEGFKGKGILDGVQGFSMQIWNRWGELVFESTNPDEEWNGRAQQTGGISPEGVYVYQVKFTGPDGEKMEYKGFATLIR